MILTIYYLFLSLPFLYLISIWGNITPSSDAEERKILKNFNFHHLGYVLTIVSFYFFPFLLFLDNLKSKVKEVFNKKNIIIFFFFFLYLIFFLFLENLNIEYYNGGGEKKKLIQLFFTNILIQKILLVLFFIICFLIIMIFRNKNHINNLIIFFLIFTSILMTPALFQEYYDPLVFILFFLFFKNKLIVNFKNCFFLFSYFLIFLISENFYFYKLNKLSLCIIQKLF